MDQICTEIEIAGVKWKNPVTTASGTFGSGMEFAAFTDIARLGAITSKGVALEPWPGNPTPRVAETPSGMMNAIGLQNPGIRTFLSRDLPFMGACGPRVIVNVCGHSIPEYCEAAEILSERNEVDMLEINISCPNVKKGGASLSQDPAAAREITREVKKVSRKPVIIKLSPNVTDIAEIARACEDGGADALSLINTFTGMKIDIYRRKFVLANQTGGVSGPAIHPIAVRMVYQTAHAVSLPVIGMGGIACAGDALEMIMAGATAVAVGTASFRDPACTLRVIEGIELFMRENHVKDIRELIGCV